MTAAPADFAGRLTKDPEVRQVGKATQVRITVAVNDGYRDKDGDWVDLPPVFFTVEAWNALAEDVRQLTKGTEVVIKGRWRAHQYENADGEKKRYQVVEALEIGSALGKCKRNSRTAQDRDGADTASSQATGQADTSGTSEAIDLRQTPEAAGAPAGANAADDLFDAAR